MTGTGGSTLETISLQIPAPLLRRVEERARETDFESAQEYILFVLSEVLADEGEEAASASLTPDEEKDLTDRLRGLGYIE